MEYEAETCPKCGNLRVICSDPTRPWYPQRHICYATADVAANNRRWEAKHENAKPVDWRLPTDGTTVWVSPENLTPDDDFL